MFLAEFNEVFEELYRLAHVYVGIVIAMWLMFLVIVFVFYKMIKR